MNTWTSIRGGLALAGIFATASIASAQGFPSKPINFIYPYAAGSNADNAWRLLGQEVGRRLGQNVVHENRPGAGGRLGLDAVMRAAPDGYTIGMFNNVLGVWQPLIDPSIAIEPGKHYTPVSLTIETPLALISNPSRPFKDVRGLIAYAKANPGKLNGSSPGPGTGGHLAIALLAAKGGVQITHVPYKGTAPATTAVVSGEVDLTFTDAASKPLIEAGKVLGLMVGSPTRWALIPQVPSAVDAGLPDFRISSWTGVVGPAGLAADVLDRLTRAFHEAANTPEVKAKLEGTGWVIRAENSAQMTQTIRADIELFRPVIREANIKLN